jgi:hypothetical protein
LDGVATFLKRALITIGVIMLVIIGGLALTIWLIVRHSKNKRRAVSRVDKRLFDKSANADSVERSLRRLRELATVYAASPSKYTVPAGPIHSQISLVIADAQELFRRLRRHGSAQQARLAEAKYADVLKKLVLAVEQDHYQDIIDNPRLWQSVAERLGAIGGALAAVHQQVLDNIKQVNASKDLEFQVALDSLLESDQAAKLSDAYGGQSADGPTQPERQ